MHFKRVSACFGTRIPGPVTLWANPAVSGSACGHEHRVVTHVGVFASDVEQLEHNQFLKAWTASQLADVEVVDE